MKSQTLPQYVLDLNKMKEWLVTLALAVVAVLAPIKTLLLAVGFLIAVDFTTGVWRAFKVKEKITSKGFRRTVTKMVAYQLAVISGFVVQKYMLDDVLPVAKLVASVIGITELKSVLENLRLITGLDFWAALREKLNPNKDIEK